MLIEENYPHAVSGEFDQKHAAQQRAQALLDIAGLKPQQIKLVKPDDDRLSEKLEPESRRIFGTMLKAHFWTALAGLAIGTVLAGIMVTVGPNWARGNAVFTFMAFAWVGTLATAFLGGMITLRPDRDRMSTGARNASENGLWTVIAHCRDQSQKDAAMRELESYSETARQSL